MSASMRSPDNNGLVQWSLGAPAGASGTKLITMRVPENGQFVLALEVETSSLWSDNDADNDRDRHVDRKAQLHD